jgi:AraC-like DNA-binding protein
LDVIARRTGFGSAETMRRAFKRELGVSPSAYRARHRTTRPSDA